MRPLSFWIGTALFSMGVVILLIAGGIYAYGLYEDHEYETAVSTATALVTLEPTTVPLTATAPPTVTIAPSPTSPVPGTLTPETTPEPSPLPMTPTTTPGADLVATTTTMLDNPQVATRIRIPAIKLDAPVTESIISKGQWVVPRFAAGHLQGTANPGVPGNAAFAGHVSSISSGNVFANIGQLAPGDEIVLVTKGGDLHYQVAGKMVVKNNDLSVIQDFGDQRVTLITCTGTWLPLQRDFNQRMVVVAMRVG